MQEHGISKNEILTVLTRSSHGDMKSYLPIGRAAAKDEAEFLAHLIAWNERNGQIRDSKVALPIASLLEPGFNGELAENSRAHLALLDPRNLVRAFRFGQQADMPKFWREMKPLVTAYLQAREQNPRWWERTTIQHRGSMKELYALCHVKPAKFADDILFKGKKTGVFKDIAGLKDMDSVKAAGVILKHKLPFLVLQGALGARLKETDIAMAMIDQMSATELVTNTKMLEKLGIKTVPALRAAYEAGLAKAADSTKATFKTTRAAEAMTDAGLKAKLQGTQEKQLTKMGGFDGNWLVIGDRSSSMEVSIEGARQVAATLARMGKGDVHLVFVNTMPQYVNATSKDYDALLAETKRVNASGGTSIGCGAQYAVSGKLDVDGIAIVSDGAENTVPWFSVAYQALCKQLDKDLPVYLYKMPGSESEANRKALERNMATAGLDMQVFDLTHGKVDYYALPNLIQTMHTNRYSLVDKIMDVPLLTLEQALKGEKHA